MRRVLGGLRPASLHGALPIRDRAVGITARAREVAREPGAAEREVRRRRLVRWVDRDGLRGRGARGPLVVGDREGARVAAPRTVATRRVLRARRPTGAQRPAGARERAVGFPARAG